jgi:hypothetical protein
VSDPWAEYAAWNDAIADVAFPELEVPKPVYLDLEGELLDEIGRRMSVDANAVEETLAKIVSGTLRHDEGPAAIFAGHMVRMRSWIVDKRRGVPPFLALLAAFCIAAEQMAAGDGMSSNNYYGRLRAVFGWDPHDNRLDHAYRRVSERLWSELNRWLVELDGLRGIPTAFALSHRYVGLPVSQALIRSADHERLKDFFRLLGFAPGTDVAPSDLVLPLGDWISANPSPVSSGLQRLWNNSSARERIAEAAAVSLANWDGSVREQVGDDQISSAGTLSLTLEMGGFPRKHFALSALFYVNGATSPRPATVLTADPPTDIDLVPDLPGALGLGAGSSLHAGDVLEGVLRIKDGLTQRVLERRPRRLVVFREDDLSRRWIESPQVMLGDNVRLLVHEDLLSRLTETLGTIARPGWQIAEAYPGQPAGWVVLADVEVFSHPGALVSTTKMDDLLPLVPLTRSQLKVAGGFALPGRVRGRWHSWAPPEIRAISDTPEGFVVRLVDEHRFDATEEPVEHVVAEWSDNGTGVVVESLADLGLVDGDFRVELVPTGARTPLSTSPILLRSSDTPDAHQWSVVDSLGYARGIGVLGVEASDEEAVVTGHIVPPVQRAGEALVEVPASPRWVTGRHQPSTPRSPVRITVPDANSCIRTGRHVEMIETVATDSQGRPLQAWSYGRCKGCGLVRRYPTRLRRSSYGHGRDRDQTDASSTVVHDLSALAPARHASIHDYATAFDALLHTGGGPWSQLERIALQVEPTALFVDQFARNLEVLGHIDIRRDSKTLQPTHWEVCPTALVGTGQDYLFAGFWPNQLYEDTSRSLADEGLDLVTGEVSEAPTPYFVNEVSLPGVALRYLTEREITVVENAWQDLVSFLPPLSDVLSGLPRQAASIEGEIRRFQTSDASWVKVASMEAPGAYRIRRFSTVDLVRTTEDVEHGTIARSTVHLSKHLAALMEGQPLLSYDRETGSLVTPLGADLPALYGRAAVASSGLPPTAISKVGLLRYESVPEDLARHIYDLFSR